MSKALEASGIVYLLEPYTPSVLKKAIKTPKVYFRDTGLAAYLTRWRTPEALAYGAMSGAMFETFVISEILKSYSIRGINYRYCVSYYRGRDKKKVRRDGLECETESKIDLIIEENGMLYPIEIKQSPAVTADEASAFTVLDKLRKAPWNGSNHLHLPAAESAEGQSVAIASVVYLRESFFICEE